MILNQLAGNLKQKKEAAISPSKKNKKRSTIAVFKKFQATYPIVADEFHTQVDPKYWSSQRRHGVVGAFTACVWLAVKECMKNLQGMKDYKPMFIADISMGIDRFAEAARGRLLDSKARARYQEQFRKELADGVQRMCIHIFGKTYGDS